MKKLIISSIAAAAILTSTTITPPVHAAETVQVKDSALNVTLTPEVLRAMKAGTYQYKGVGLGTYMGTVRDKYGIGTVEQVSRDYTEGYTYMTAIYTKDDRLTLTAEAAAAISDAGLDRVRVNGMALNFEGKRILKRDVEKTLGTADTAEGSTSGKGPIYRKYGLADVVYERTKDTNQWVVSAVMMQKDLVSKAVTQAPGGMAYQTKDIRFPVTKSSVSAMKKGTYQVQGVTKKIGLYRTMREVTQEFGRPHFDTVTRGNLMTHYSAIYGDTDDLTVNSEVYGYTRNGELRDMLVSEMIFGMDNQKISKGTFEKYTGAATKADGSIKSDTDITREYGNSLGAFYTRPALKDPFKLDGLSMHVKADVNGNYVADPGESPYPQ